MDSMRTLDAAATAAALPMGALIDALRERFASGCEVPTRGMTPGRRSAGERTVFKSVRTALEDLGAASLVWAAQPEGQQPKSHPGVPGCDPTANPPA